MTGSRCRSYGTKKQSVANKRASAMQYLVMAREPTVERLIALFGLRPNEARRMLDDEMRRRDNGSASAELRRAFDG